jgi:hypothetical protein
MRTLYLTRPVENATDLADWAGEQGFAKTVPPEKLHVTIAYSSEPIDWEAILWRSDIYDVPEVCGRWLEILENDAVALCFQSVELVARWQEIRDLGASWDFPEYTPHVTLAFKAGDVDVARIKPYMGPLRFGAEVFDVIPEDKDLW